MIIGILKTLFNLAWTILKWPLIICGAIVHRQKPTINADGEVEKMKSLGWYCWVHDKKIRESYDTYKVIETLVKTGFVPRNEQLKSFDSVNTKIKVSNEKTKKSK